MSVPEGIAEILPLTPLQRSVLAEAEALGRDAPEPEIVVLQLASLDVDALERAWLAVQSRHAALRLSIHSRGLSAAVQVVHREAPSPVRRRDWSDVAPGALQARLAEFLKRELAEPPSLAQAPPMRLAAMRTRRGGLFAWTYSPLALDRLSVCMTIETLLVEYARQKLPEFARLETPAALDPYRALVERLQATDAVEARVWWAERFAGAELAQPVAPPAPISRKVRRRDVTLSTNLGEALRALVRKRKANLETLLLAAWSLALAKARRRDDAGVPPSGIVVGISVSGRPAGDEFAATVGGFGHVVPFPVEFPQDQPVAAWIDRLHGLRRDLQRRQAYPVAEIRRWIGASDGDPLFETIVDAASSTPGQLRRRRRKLAATLPRAAGERARTLVPPRLTERRAVEVRLDERRGALAIRLAWSPERCDDGEATLLIEGLRDSLQALVARSGETVGTLFGERSGSVAIPLASGGAEPAAPLYLVHPAGGEVDCYAALAQQLGKRRAVIALETPEWMGLDSPPPTIEALAERLAGEILATSPQGRIAIAGWSFGGMLAYAVAQRLERTGHPAPAVAMIDATFPTATEAARPRISTAKAVQRLAAQRGWPAPRKLPPQADASQLAQRIVKQAIRKSRASDDRTAAGFLRQAKLFAEHIHAARRYRPLPFSGPTLLVRPMRVTEEEPPDEGGWEQVASDLTTVDLAGTHRSILQPPQVRDLAAALEAFLDRACASPFDAR